MSEQHLIRAALSARNKLPDTKAATSIVLGHADLIRAIRANARVFTALPGVDDVPRQRNDSMPASELVAVLDTLVDSSRLADLHRVANESTLRQEWRMTNEWSAAAALLHAAADTLQTHIGPVHEHRTPDAKLLDDGDTRHAVVVRLAQMALTASEAQQHLALRIREAGASPRRNAWLLTVASRLLDTQAPLAIAAANAITDRTTSAIPERVTALQAAPLLRPTRSDDPITAARQSFDRIRLLAHRQGRGEVPAGIDAIRAYSTTAALIAMHAHAIAAAASAASRQIKIDPVLEPHLKQMARMLAEARAPWVAVAEATDRCSSIRHSPPVLIHELDVFAGSLARLTRNGDHWRDVDSLMPSSRVAGRLLNLAKHLVEKLPELASATAAVTNQLYVRGDLLIPTRDREDLDRPYKWAPINAVRITALRKAGVTAALTARAVAAPLLVIERSRLTIPLHQEHSVCPERDDRSATFRPGDGGRASIGAATMDF